MIPACFNLNFNMFFIYNPSPQLFGLIRTSPNYVQPLVDTTGFQAQSDALSKKYANLNFIKRTNDQDGKV